MESAAGLDKGAVMDGDFVYEDRYSSSGAASTTAAAASPSQTISDMPELPIGGEGTLKYNILLELLIFSKSF